MRRRVRRFRNKEQYGTDPINRDGDCLMDWLTGALTIVAMELIGRKMWQGWLVGLLNQVFWAYLIIDHELYGLIPLTAILTWRYSAHLLRWRKER